nr:hypothetical protein [Glaciihabitans sp. dw_435]
MIQRNVRVLHCENGSLGRNLGQRLITLLAGEATVIAFASSHDFEPARFTYSTDTPACAAIAFIVVPAYPFSPNSSAAAVRIATLVRMACAERFGYR